MARLTGFLLVCCVALLSACSGQHKTSSSPSPINQAASAIEPRVVVQLGHQTPVIVVRWVDQGRHLVSLASDGSLVFWDVATGAILDHAQVPIGDPASDVTSLSFREMKPGADARTLTIVYAIPDGDKTSTDAACPAAARSKGRWCAFILDLATRAVDPDNNAPAPETYSPSSGDNAKNFPLSPDGKLRPEPNRADGKRGLFDQTDDHLQFEDPTCVSKQRCRYGVNLFRVSDGEAQIKLTGSPRGYFRDADLSEDGRRLVRVEGLWNDTQAQVQTLDLVNGIGDRTFLPKQAYHHVSWLGSRRYGLFSDGYRADDDTSDAQEGFPPALVVDPTCSTNGRCPAIESAWQMQPLDDAGSFVALGSLKPCFRNRNLGVVCPMGGDAPDEGGNDSEAPVAKGLSIHMAGDRGWRLMKQPAWTGQTITAVKLSPDRQRLAVATRVWDRVDRPDAKQVLRLWILNLTGDAATAPPRERLQIVNAITETHAEGGPAFSDRETIRDLSFTSDGKRIIFAQTPAHSAARADLYIVETEGAAKPRKIPGFSRRVFAAGNDRVFGLDTQQLLDINSGKTIASDMGQTPLVKAGWIGRSRLLWAATDDGAIRFWDGVDGAPQLTLYMFPDNRFFAVTPGGRYDTNQGPDTGLVRWLVPDAPWQSLAAQTFMRDFYEPGLYGRLLDCREAGTCGGIFKQLPAIATLNRVMPQVRITDVKPGKDAREAIVGVEVSEGNDRSAANGKTRSGVYNPRLFRNGRVVAMTPDQADPLNDNLDTWRKRNKVGGTRRFTFTVPLPTGPGSETQVFSAYAFNEDRIKSETATFTYTRPAVAPRRPKAFVVAIGVDDYDTPRFKLNYSVADARLMAERLANIPGYETHRLILAGERKADGQRTRVDNTTIRRILSLLTGDRDRAATLTALQHDGIDASMLRPATPDDLVIVSFSGHGWADPKGNFYLIPTNGRWPEGADTPDLASVLATTDLVSYFRGMSAADIALIIDACHSSASVANGRFKPGPMGDSGLGQLAYDKGILVLAATQADDVAMEDGKLRQGLLTYALAAEGLSPTGGKADLDGDRHIGLNEWLTYAVQRLPSLSEDVRVGQIGPSTSGARAITFHDLPVDAPKRRVQQPSLFDFNARPSPVVLRRISR